VILFYSLLILFSRFPHKPFPIKGLAGRFENGNARTEDGTVGGRERFTPGQDCSQAPDLQGGGKGWGFGFRVAAVSSDPLSGPVGKALGGSGRDRGVHPVEQAPTEGQGRVKVLHQFPAKISP
jgi:hypothetical protein